MRGIKKGKALILSALICTIIFAIIGIQDATSINAETPEETAKKQVKEITIVTVTPKKLEAKEYIDFDLRNLSIVRKEGEKDVVNNRGSRESASVAEVSLRNEPDTSDDTADTYDDTEYDSANERDTGEADGSEMAESEQEQWSESEDIVSEDGDGEPILERVESDPGGSGDGSEPEEGLTEEAEWVYYDNCRITFYDTGACCCGEWASGYTASGTLATVGRTVATGEDIPFGTEVMIDGQVYIAEDRGVGYGEIDVLVNDHQTALNMGMYYTDVYIRSAD